MSTAVCAAKGGEANLKHGSLRFSGDRAYANRHSGQLADLIRIGSSDEIDDRPLCAPSFRYALLHTADNQYSMRGIMLIIPLTIPVSAQPGWSCDDSTSNV